MANNYTALGQYLKDVQAASNMTANAVAPPTEPSQTVATGVVRMPTTPVRRSIDQPLPLLKSRTMTGPQLAKTPSGVMTEQERKAMMAQVPNITDDELTRAAKWLRTTGLAGPMTEKDIYRAVQEMRKVKPKRVIAPTTRRGLGVGSAIRRALIGQIGEQAKNLLLNR